MDTPALTPQTSARPAGNTAEVDTTQTDATATGFAALLALELAPTPAPTADIAEEPGLSADDETEAQEGAAVSSFAADPLASLQLPAVSPRTFPERGGVRSAADFPPDTAARIDAKQAKSAAGGNSPLPVSVAGDRGPNAALPDQSVAAQELPTQPLGSWQAAPLSPQTPAAAAASATLPRVEVPVFQSGWSEAFAQRVLLLAGKQQQSAELHLNPPDLGPVSIVLSMDNDLANVFFSSPLVPVREAIENAMPTLREALGQAGIQLGEASVSSESFRSKADTREQPRSSAAPGEADQHNDRAQHTPTRHPGLVDTFA